MKSIITNNCALIIFAALFSATSLAYSCFSNDKEWFQASGAVVTLCGSLLAARKIIRLGFQEFIKHEQTIDGGAFGHEKTPEEIESEKQFKSDMRAYPQSIWLICIGTIIWAYGGLLLKAFGVDD